MTLCKNKSFRQYKYHKETNTRNVLLFNYNLTIWSFEPDKIGTKKFKYCVNTLLFQ